MGRRRLSIAYPIEPILERPDIGQKIKNRIVLATITDHNPNPAFVRILENRFHIAPMFVHLLTRVEKHKAITLAMEIRRPINRSSVDFVRTTRCLRQSVQARAAPQKPHKR